MIFKTWKTIDVGTHKNVASLQKSLIGDGFQIGDWAKDVMNIKTFPLSSRKEKLSLARVTVGELGLTKGGDVTEVYKKALEQGLELCPLEVGPQLRLQYKDQPVRESLQIGMEQQVDSEEHPSEFRVVHSPYDGLLWLVGDHKHLDNFWNSDELFIFVLPS